MLSTLKLENGILVVQYSEGLRIDLPKAKELVRMRLEYQQGKSYPILIYSNGFKIDSSEARDYMKTEGIKGIKAGAFIVSNAVEKFIVNFFLYINPPAVPAKMFTKAQEAIEWLKQYK